MLVPYHAGRGNDWSLRFASPSYSDAAEYAQGRDSARVLSFNCPEHQMFAVYTASSQGSPPAANSVTVDHPITEALVRVFRGVVDGTPSISGNKEASLADIPSRLGGQVDWGDRCAVVGGQLWSSLVRLHPLPNANHRSSLGLVLLYLQTNDIDVGVSSLDEAATNAAIRESKRLLTVRRRCTPFRLLQEAGCTGVERKNGVTIAFEDYDLNVDDPYSYYDTRHEEHAISFVEALLPREARGQRGQGFASFRDTISS